MTRIHAHLFIINSITMLDHANATFIKPVTFAASDIVPGRVKNEVFQRDFLSRSYGITSIDMIQMDSILSRTTHLNPHKIKLR